MALATVGAMAGKFAVSELLKLAAQANEAGWTQHNTWVVNNTGDHIIMLLHSRSGQKQQAEVQPIERGGRYTFQTPNGDICLYVLNPQNQVYADCQKPAKSDRSFIVKKVGGQYQIVKSVYGHIYQESTGNE